MLFTSIRYAARYTTTLEAAEPSQLGGVAVRRRAINYDVGGCVVQIYEFKPRVGNNFFFSLLLFAINKAYLYPHTGCAVPLRCLYGINRSGIAIVAVVPQ